MFCCRSPPRDLHHSHSYDHADECHPLCTSPHLHPSVPFSFATPSQYSSYCCPTSGMLIRSRPRYDPVTYDLESPERANRRGEALVAEMSALRESLRDGWLGWTIRDTLKHVPEQPAQQLRNVIESERVELRRDADLVESANQLKNKFDSERAELQRDIDLAKKRQPDLLPSHYQDPEQFFADPLQELERRASRKDHHRWDSQDLLRQARQYEELMRVKAEERRRMKRDQSRQKPEQKRGSSDSRETVIDAKEDHAVEFNPPGSTGDAAEIEPEESSKWSQMIREALARKIKKEPQHPATTASPLREPTSRQDVAGGFQRSRVEGNSYFEDLMSHIDATEAALKDAVCQSKAAAGSQEHNREYERFWRNFPHFKTSNRLYDLYPANSSSGNSQGAGAEVQQPLKDREALLLDASSVWQHPHDSGVALPGSHHVVGETMAGQQAVGEVLRPKTSQGKKLLTAVAMESDDDESSFHTAIGTRDSSTSVDRITGSLMVAADGNQLSALESGSFKTAGEPSLIMEPKRRSVAIKNFARRVANVVLPLHTGPRASKPISATCNVTPADVSNPMSKREGKRPARHQSEELHDLELLEEVMREIALSEALSAYNELLEEVMREIALSEALSAYNERNATTECVCCGDEKSTTERFSPHPPTYACEHPVQTCTECMQQWLASELKGKGCKSLHCPECMKVMEYEDVLRGASEATRVEYDKRLFLDALSEEGEFAWCLAPKCNSGQLNPENGNYMECASCKYRQCLNHKSPWHQGENCEQFDRRTKIVDASEVATNAMIDSVSKICPGKGCGWRIQKLDGCDHITCAKCRHQFCWRCLADHKEIKRVGNTAHRSDCKFHSRNLEVSWPFNVHS